MLAGAEELLEARGLGAVSVDAIALRAGVSKATIYRWWGSKEEIALEAFYLKGRTLLQMACEFEVPTGTVKRRLHVARQRLREALEGIDPTLAEQFAGDEAELAAV